MSAALLTKLIEAGTPADLVAEVAMELGRAAAATEALENRRRHERERKAKSRDVTGQNVTGRDVRGQPPVGFPKERNQTPSLPPAQCSEPDGSSTEPRAWTLPAGVSLQVWDDFKRNRKRKRLLNTDTAWKGFNDDLERVSSQTGIPPPKLIEQCTAKGWGAIYDPREEQNVRRTNSMGRNQPADGLSSTARAAISVFGPPSTSEH